MPSNQKLKNSLSQISLFAGILIDLMRQSLQDLALEQGGLVTWRGSEISCEAGQIGPATWTYGLRALGSPWASRSAAYQIYSPQKVKSNHVDDNEFFSYFYRNSSNLELNLSLTTPKASQ